MKSLSLKTMKRRDFKHVCAHTFLEVVKMLLITHACVCYQILFLIKRTVVFFKKRIQKMYLNFPF